MVLMIPNASAIAGGFPACHHVPVPGGCGLVAPGRHGTKPPFW